jgi:hypothetical protein
VRRRSKLLVVTLLVAACGTPASSPSAPAASVAQTAASTVSPTAMPATPGPSGTVAPTAGPSATPPVTPGAVIAPGTAVEVVAVELNLRRRPSTSARRVALLLRGEVLVISPIDGFSLGWGPVEADGFTWYPVARVTTPTGELPALPAHPLFALDGEPVSGWIAAGEGSRPYIRAMTARCPATPNLRRVAGMLPAERLSCFGANPIVLEGTFGCDGCGGITIGTFDPPWLATPAEFDFLTVDPSVQLGPLALRFPPDGPERPEPGSIIRATMHMHDPRSLGCSIVEGEGADAVSVPAETAELYCRERLVVESYEVIGTDPRFPGG